MSAAVTDAQKNALADISPELPAGVYLAGGVAVALRLHHRSSKDLDLFTGDTDPLALVDALLALGRVTITKRAPGTLYLEISGVPTSIIRYRYPLLAAPQMLDGIAVAVADFDDLICMKLSAIASRGALRDFWDLHAMLNAKRLGLPEALEAFQRKYETEDFGHVVRSIAYFADADAEPRPIELTLPTWEAIKDDLRRWVVAL
jgi:hypothetical protein